MIPKRRPRPFVPRKKETEHRLNRDINVPEVRIVGEEIEQGVYSIQRALELAKELEVDLVEISPNSSPPVCRLVDYNKFLYDKKKKEKEIKAKQKKTEVKEIRFTPNTDEHDLDFKLKHAIKFLQEGSKVKIYVQFKGRAIQFKDRGELVLLQFAESLKEYGGLEAMPNLEGKKMIAYIAPKKK